MPRDSAAADRPASYLVGTAAAFPLFFRDRTKPINQLPFSPSAKFPKSGSSCDSRVKDYVLARRLRQREVFVPLRHDPGHVQADFGEAQAEIAWVERKIHFFAIDLPHSDACFVQAYPEETTEAFCDGHNAAFRFFGGVPKSILYDNTKLAVARILGA